MKSVKIVQISLLMSILFVVLLQLSLNAIVWKDDISFSFSEKFFISKDKLNKINTKTKVKKLKTNTVLWLCFYC